MAAAAAPKPKSPPASPDPCGRHRLQLAVDALHREIGFLELQQSEQLDLIRSEQAKYYYIIILKRSAWFPCCMQGEISSIEGVHAASRCCKEVDEFVARNPDPFLTIQPEKGSHDQSQQFLKKFRGKSCLSYYLSWMCGGGWCPPLQLKRPPAPSCSCAPRLGKLCSSSSSCCCCCCCRFRVVYAAAGCGCCAPCPRCSCDCTCACPRCCSCACPMCCAPRCCLCL